MTPPGGGGGGGAWGPGQPWPTPPPTHIRKFVLRHQKKFIKGAGNLRPISGTRTFFLPSDIPPLGGWGVLPKQQPGHRDGTPFQPKPRRRLTFIHAAMASTTTMVVSRNSPSITPNSLRIPSKLMRLWLFFPERGDQGHTGTSLHCTDEGLPRARGRARGIRVGAQHRTSARQRPRRRRCATDCLSADTGGWRTGFVIREGEGGGGAAEPPNTPPLPPPKTNRDPKVGSAKIKFEEANPPPRPPAPPLTY